MIESKDNIFQVFLDSKTMLMTIGLVNGKLVLTHLSFFIYHIITVGMRRTPIF